MANDQGNKLDNPLDLMGYAVGYMGMSVRDFLGLSCNDRYSLNYDEFRCIHKWHQKRLEDEHRSFALVCATLANIHRGKKGKKFSIDDFMMTPKRRMSAKQMTGMLIAAFGIEKADK